MRTGWRKFVHGAATAAIGLSLGTASFGQTGSTDEGKRKVKSKVAPAYPELAKRMSVSGKVKIEVVITPEGRVKSTRVIGGHPLLGSGLPGRGEGMEVCGCTGRNHADRGI